MVIVLPHQNTCWAYDNVYVEKKVTKSKQDPIHHSYLRTCLANQCFSWIKGTFVSKRYHFTRTLQTKYNFEMINRSVNIWWNCRRECGGRICAGRTSLKSCFVFSPFLLRICKLRPPLLRVKGKWFTWHINNGTWRKAGHWKENMIIEDHIRFGFNFFFNEISFNHLGRIVICSTK